MSRSAIYIHIFVLAAFVLSGISPACAFVSGKSFAEICGADGTIQTVEIDADLLPFLPDDEPAEDEHLAQIDCGFCFAASNLKQFSAAQNDTLVSKSARYIQLSSGVYAPAGQDLKPYNSQGPPSTFV